MSKILLIKGLADTSTVQATEGSLNRSWVHPSPGFKAEMLSLLNSKQRLPFIEGLTQLYDTTKQIQLSSYLIEKRVPAEITTLLGSYCVSTEH